MNKPNRCNPTLYYDGQCPLCSAEVSRLSRLVDGTLQLTDIHTLDSDTALPAKETLLRTLHLRDENGQFLVGLEANVRAWQYTRWGGLFRWLLWWPIRPVANWCYATWADVRFRRRYSEAD